MKNSAYNKHLEQQQYIGYWLKSVGLTLRTLEHHPCIEDIVLLTVAKRSTEYSKREATAWQLLWNKAFESRRCLDKNDLDKLYCNTEKAIFRQQTRATKQADAIHKIRQMRGI